MSVMTTDEGFSVAMAVNDGYQAGVLAATKLGGCWERERIVKLAQNKVCFDNRDTGECDHSVCYGMIDLIVLIKGEDK